MKDEQKKLVEKAKDWLNKHPNVVFSSSEHGLEMTSVTILSPQLHMLLTIPLGIHDVLGRLCSQCRNIPCKHRERDGSQTVLLQVFNRG